MPDVDSLPAFPSSAAPKVAKAPFNPETATPEELAMQPLTSRLRKDEAKDLNPWGTAQNHPGFWGKFGHALSVATGGPDRRQYEEMGLQKSLQDLLGSESRNDLEGAQTEEAKARTNAIENPAPKEPSEQRPYTIATDKGELQWTGHGWEPIQVNGETVNPPEKPGAMHPFQRVAGTAGGSKETVYANYDPMHGVFLDQTGKVIPDFHPADKALQGAYGGFGPAFLAYRMLNSAYNENPALLPYIAPLISKMLSQSGGSVPGMEQVLGAVPAGQPQDEKGTPIGLRMPGAPTGATRSRGQFAEAVIPSVTDAEQEIERLGNDLGPMSGRWSELYTGKIGAYGPQFSHLQTELKNIGTAWMRLHANSESARREFEEMLRGAQSPANLIANLNAIEQQAQDYVREGRGRPDELKRQAKPEPPKAGDVVNGYRFKGGDPAQQSSWEKVK